MSSMIREIQVNSTMTDQYALTRMAKIKKQMNKKKPPNPDNTKCR